MATGLGGTVRNASPLGEKFNKKGWLILLMEEIRRSPVEVGSLSHDLQHFSTIPGS